MAGSDHGPAGEGVRGRCGRISGSLEWAPHANQLAFFAWDAGAGARSGKFHVLGRGQHEASHRFHDRSRLASAGNPASTSQRAVLLDGRLGKFARRNPP